LRNPRTPWYIRALTVLLTAYALSPIDLIPDFIPLLGYLDDLIIVPLGVWLLLKLLPAPIRVVSQAQSAQWLQTRQSKPRSRLGLAMVLGLWVLAGWVAYSLFIA
jgi:uncharacterized membrane protein YkvA (DUF1232 family)